MAVKKGTLRRKNGIGTYDEIDLRTSGAQVNLSDGTTVQDFVDAYVPGSIGGSSQVVADTTARDALTAESGQIVWVIDATGDTSVTAGAASYIWDGSNWIKMSEAESMDIVVAWASITGKPDIVDIQVSATQPVGQKEGDIWIEETV